MKWNGFHEAFLDGLQKHNKQTNSFIYQMDSATIKLFFLV